MLRTVLFFSTIAVCVAFPAKAQTTYTEHLQKKTQGQGEVVINQSAEIERLVNNYAPAVPEKKPAPERSETHPEAATHNEVPAHSAKNSGTARTHVARTRHKARGYRICIYTGGNSRADKTKALQMGQKCRNLFPELSAYTSFVAPRWVTNVGDFRTRQDAQKYVSRIRKARFTYEVRIVSSEVNLPDEN